MGGGLFESSVCAYHATTRAFCHLEVVGVVVHDDLRVLHPPVDIVQKVKVVADIKVFQRDSACIREIRAHVGVETR